MTRCTRKLSSVREIYKEKINRKSPVLINHREKKALKIYTNVLRKIRKDNILRKIRYCIHELRTGCYIK